MDGSLEIMTGATAPRGTEAIIKIEDLKIEKKIATYIGKTPLEKGQFIHLQGADAPAGSVLVKKRTKIGPVEIAIAATLPYRGPQGTVKYVAALLGELRALRALHIQVAINDAVDNHEVTLMAIGNTSSYGGGMLVCPSADAYDSQLEVMRVARVNRRTLLRVFPRVFRGTHVSHPAVTMGQVSRLEIGGDSFPIYADGERIGMGPAVVSVIPAGLTVLHPKETQ
jgi:hypothetical protein